MSQPTTTDEALGSAAMIRIQKADKSAPGNKLLRNVLLTVAEGYDRVRPGAGDCVREMADEKYPEAQSMTSSEALQHLANLCPSHKGKLLPMPTVAVCVECAAEREAGKS